MDLNLLRTFCKVAELGSFTKAARQLKQPKSRVSRAISRLEEEMSVQLIRRTTRQMTLTEAGKTLFQKSHHLLHSLQSELEAISTERCKIAGPLKISAPEDFGMGVLSHLLPLFLERYPEVEFDLLFTNEYVDLVAEQVDLAFRIGQLEDSTLVQRKLGTIQMILVASPEFLNTYGIPKSQAELQHFRLLDFYNENRDYSVLARAFPEHKLKSNIKSNHFSLLQQMALQHRGIAPLPDFFAHRCLQSGHLKRVLPEWAGAPVGIHIIYPPTPQMPLKTRTFIDFIVAESPVCFGES